MDGTRITEDQLVCEGNLAKRWEYVEIKNYSGKKIKDDRPIEPNFYIGYTFDETDWGLSGDFHGGTNGGSYTWDSPVGKPRRCKKC
ncbi:MAG: hypothetical protein U5N58_05100 [Actinomycetota bacterium]|nr:hypothetical protein [Actinomycetota bacterium]